MKDLHASEAKYNFLCSAVRSYALRYIVAHVYRALDVKLLKDMLLDFRMWEAIYKAGE